MLRVTVDHVLDQLQVGGHPILTLFLSFTIAELRGTRDEAFALDQGHPNNGPQALSGLPTPFLWPTSGK